MFQLAKAIFIFASLYLNYKQVQIDLHFLFFFSVW